MANSEELERAVARGSGRKESKTTNALLPAVSGALEPQEKVLIAVTGRTIRGDSCLVVATSRQVLVATTGRVDSFPYTTLQSVEFHESWRKGGFELRTRGAVADVKDIHLDRARELEKMIQVARRTSQPHV